MAGAKRLCSIFERGRYITKVGNHWFVTSPRLLTKDSASCHENSAEEHDVSALSEGPP